MNFLLQKGSGSLVGICRHEGSIVTAAQSGVVTVWTAEEKKPSFDAVQREVSLMGKKLKRKDLDEEEREKHSVKLGEGKELSRMRQNAFSKNMVGVAGKEVELQLWDLNKMEEPVFRSKNVGLDMLCLRQVNIILTAMKMIKTVFSSLFGFLTSDGPQPPQFVSPRGTAR